jgi:hypothetical protein
MKETGTFPWKAWAATALLLGLSAVGLTLILKDDSRQPPPKVQDLSTMDFARDVGWEQEKKVDPSNVDGRTILLDWVTSDAKTGKLMFLVTTPLGQKKDKYAIIRLDQGDDLAKEVAEGKIRRGHSILVSLERIDELGPEKESLEKRFKKADFYTLRSWKQN